MHSRINVFFVIQTECIRDLDLTLIKWEDDHFTTFNLSSNFSWGSLPKISSSLRQNHQIKLVQIPDTHCGCFLSYDWEKLQVKRQRSTICNFFFKYGTEWYSEIWNRGKPVIGQISMDASNSVIQQIIYMSTSIKNSDHHEDDKPYYDKVWDPHFGAYIGVKLGSLNYFQKQL